MARTNNTVSLSAADQLNRQALRDILLNGVNKQESDDQTVGEWINDKASDAAATVFDTTSRVAAAGFSAFSNARQAFKLEKNFRDAERNVKIERMVDRYEARLAKLLPK